MTSEENTPIQIDLEKIKAHPGLRFVLEQSGYPLVATSVFMEKLAEHPELASEVEKLLEVSDSAQDSDRGTGHSELVNIRGNKVIVQLLGDPTQYQEVLDNEPGAFAAAALDQYEERPPETRDQHYR